MIGKLEAKISSEEAMYEMFCIKCRNIKHIDKNPIKEDNSFVTSFEKVVLEDHFCDKCGCNTFDIDAFINFIVKF